VLLSLRKVQVSQELPRQLVLQTMKEWLLVYCFP
jgi:hypothetical protein